MDNPFSTALGLAPIVLFRQDRESRYLWVWDGSGCFGPDFSEGKTEKDVFSDNESSHLKALRQKVFSSGQAQQQVVELWIGGNPAFYHFYIRPLLDDLGNVAEVSGLAFEVTTHVETETELRKAVASAETASLAKSAFLSTMSHEIRTPLTAVMGFASILAKELAGEHREFAQLIEYSGKRLLDMLGLVLTLAKLDSGSPDVRLDELEIAGEVEAIVQLLQPMAADKYLVLTYRVSAEAGAVRACLDRGALNSIMYNLIGNAIKYTDEGGIDVVVDTDGKNVRITVTDTGLGIDPAFIPHLFDPFSQENHRAHVEGVGLGMSITKRLVEMMKGSIVVASEKGAGSRFTISFPYVAGKKQAAEDTYPAEPVNPDTRDRRHLLLVEDNPDTSFLMKHVLQDFYDVTIASRPEEALDEAHRVSFDLVLMDINLGGEKTGMDVLRELRVLPQYTDVPVLAITAYALPGDRERFLGTGFDAYLSKPFAVDELLELIAASLSA